MEEKKDNFWLYIGGLVVVVAAVIFIVKGSEHGKYEKQRALEAESPTNSAYPTN
jgi:hypothetical protein